MSNIQPAHLAQPIQPAHSAQPNTKADIVLAVTDTLAAQGFAPVPTRQSAPFHSVVNSDGILLKVSDRALSMLVPPPYGDELYPDMLTGIEANLGASKLAVGMMAALPRGPVDGHQLLMAMGAMFAGVCDSMAVDLDGAFLQVIQALSDDVTVSILPWTIMPDAPASVDTACAGLNA